MTNTSNGPQPALGCRFRRRKATRVRSTAALFAKQGRRRPLRCKGFRLQAPGSNDLLRERPWSERTPETAVFPAEDGSAERQGLREFELTGVNPCR